MSPGRDFRGVDRERCVSYFTLLWWSKNALSAMAGRRKRRVDCPETSGNLLPPSPPAEKATARQDQAGKASADDGGGNAIAVPKAKSVLAVESQHARRRLKGGAPQATS